MPSGSSQLRNPDAANSLRVVLVLLVLIPACSASCATGHGDPGPQLDLRPSRTAGLLDGWSHDVLGVAPIHRLNKLDASPAFITEKNREPGHWGCRVAALFLAAGTKQNLVERHLLPAEAPVADAQSPSRREWVEQGRMCALLAQSWNPRAGANGWKLGAIKHPNFGCLSRLASLTTPAQIFLKRLLFR